MEALMTSSADATSPSALSAIKSTQATTVTSVPAISRAKAQAESNTKGTTVAPDILTRVNEQAEANRLNQAYQAVIGAKKGATKGIVAKVGTAMTDAVLWTPDGVNYKGINEYELCDVADAAISGANRPATADVLALLSGVINYAFDFHKKVNQNVEVL